MKLFLMSSVHPEINKSFLPERAWGSILAVIDPERFVCSIKNIHNFLTHNLRYIGLPGMETSAMAGKNIIKVKGQGHLEIS